MAHDGHIISKDIRPLFKVKLSEMGLEEVEGKFFEKFRRQPDAAESMTFYAIETKHCPICGEKNLDQAVLHMMKHFEIPLDALNRNRRQDNE